MRIITQSTCGKINATAHFPAWYILLNKIKSGGVRLVLKVFDHSYVHWTFTLIIHVLYIVLFIDWVKMYWRHRKYQIYLNIVKTIVHIFYLEFPILLTRVGKYHNGHQNKTMTKRKRTK